MSQPRLRLARRDQMTFRCESLDQLLPPDHMVRTVWAFTLQLDLTPLYATIKAVKGHVGNTPIDPRILFALWLYATLDGVGSARELERLTTSHLAYQWLCGDVSVNYHTLADFRVAHPDWLDGQLTDTVAVLLQQGLVTLQHVAQDGMKVRAAAGADTFRRQPTLERCRREAEDQVEKLSRQTGESDTAVSRRQQAARERATREKAERLQAALDHLPAVHASREAFKKGTGDQARVSTTDPEARTMKMPDGGFRPAYNVQFATDVASGLVVDAMVVNRGTDNGLMGPCVERIGQRYGRAPQAMLVDAGFGSLADIDRLATTHGTTTYMPVKFEKKLKAQGKDPSAPRSGDTPAVRDWRARMGTAAAQTIYKNRSSSAEWVNAGCRNRGWYRVSVRGVAHVTCCALWQALAHNLVTTHRRLKSRANLAEPSGGS
jgi:transposase